MALVDCESTFPTYRRARPFSFNALTIGPARARVGFRLPARIMRAIRRRGRSLRYGWYIRIPAPDRGLYYFDRRARFARFHGPLSPGGFPPGSSPPNAVGSWQARGGFPATSSLLNSPRDTVGGVHFSSALRVALALGWRDVLPNSPMFP